MKTVALLTDLWPSESEPHNGTFVRAQAAAVAGHVRQAVLVPRLVLPGVHTRIWAGSLQGAQRGWLPLPDGTAVLRYPFVRLPRRGEAAVRARSARAVLAAHRVRPSLVHGHFLFEVGVAAVALAGRLGVPSVVTVHGTDARWLLDGGVQERHRAAMLDAARRADRVVVVEAGLADRLVTAGVSRERVVVLPMGVDADTFVLGDRERARRTLGVPPDEQLVVSIARPTEQKGIDVLETAAERLDGVRCVRLGPRGRPHGALEEAGVLSPAGVATWLAASDVFCLASREEGTPVSVVEALACGRPVVASGVGGVRTQVRDGVDGLLVEPGDPDALVAALREALARPWQAEDLRRRSEPFWTSVLAPRLLEVYEAVA